MKRFLIHFAICLLSFFPISILNASIIHDGDGNNTLTTATEIDPYFSVGANSDVGSTAQNVSDWTHAPDPLTIPWVSISNNTSQGQVDYFKFSVSQANSRAWIDVDYGYESLFGQTPTLTDYNTRIQVFDINNDAVSSTGFYNDGDYRYGGTGSSIYSYKPSPLVNHDTLDAFWFSSNPLAVGTYYIKISGPNDSYVIPTTADYTLQVSVTDHSVSSVPAPSAVFLLGTGLVGLFAFRKNLKR